MSLNSSVTVPVGSERLTRASLERRLRSAPHGRPRCPFGP